MTVSTFLTADQSVASEPPPLLAHYTTRAGLLGLLRKGEVWASSIHYLNDAAEFRWAVEGASRMLDHTCNAFRPEVKESISRQFRVSLAILRTFEPFVFCLTRHADQLSQWRGYAPRGGCCLVFQTRDLEDGFESHGFSLRKCEYVNEWMSESIQMAVSRQVDLLCKPPFSTNGTLEQLNPGILEHIDTLAYMVTSKAPGIKHYGFKEEDEWRFVGDDLALTTEIRDGTASLVPFVRVPLNDALHKSLVKVIVGPSEDRTLARESVIATLSAFGYQAVVVEDSVVPFRTASLGR